ncbi:MAG TPA: hypothetical protein DCS93_14810 [Microscillaceae bacterium]|nr:hypothetical protein [Microscillaceae bacterium]
MNHNKYIPDEATLMAYLYEELEGAERKKVEAYLEQNPEAKAELEGLQDTRGIMGMLGDQQVEQPLILMTNGSEQPVPAAAMLPQEKASHETSQPKERLITMGFARTLIGIAAAIILVFLMGALTNLQIKSGGQEGFAISFGKNDTPIQPNTQKPTIVREEVNPQEVQKLLSAYMKNYGDNFTKKLGSLEQKMALQNQQVLNAQKSKDEPSEVNGFTVTEVQMMLDNLKKDNLKTMVELIRLSNKDQRDYVGRAIADYARFIDDQRDSDLKNINRTINNLDDRTKSQQLQSDRLLARVIERVNQNQTNKKDSKNRR